MSTVATESTSALGSPSVRARGTGRGRPGRTRGRGRGSSQFQFHASSKPETTTGSSEGVKAPSANGHLSSSEGKRRPFRKASNARRASTTAAQPDGVTANAQSASKPALEKEPPPHIAGAAVDAESLVSRVRELAINGHAHTSSVESRFSTHLNWADEEDDPDSLPDLDDWAIPSKSVDVSVTQKIVEDIPAKQAAVAEPALEPAKQAETTTQEDTCVPTESEAAAVPEAVPSQVATEAAQAPSTPKSQPRQGLEASIWASSPSLASPPPPNRTATPRGRHTRSASHRPPSNTNPAFQPTHFSRNSVADATLSPQPPQQGDTKPSPRKPHSRPIISGAALANISRTLGKDSPRQPQSTPT
jgi:hypothetical protein